MKRIFVCFLVLLLLTASACTAQERTYTVQLDSTEFLVDTESSTISDGTNMYRYEYTGNADAYSITITYPNGASFWQNKSGNTATAGWSDDYESWNPDIVDGMILCDILLQQAPKPIKPGKLIAALALFVLGIFAAVFPEAAWHLELGWRFRDAEPSSAALIAFRVCGVAAVIGGVIVLL